MSFIVAGYLDAEAYESRQPAWDGDDEYVDREAAESAGRGWLSGKSDEARVELIELSHDGREGLVRRVLSQTSYEDVYYPGNSSPWSTAGSE